MSNPRLAFLRLRMCGLAPVLVLVACAGGTRYSEAPQPSSEPPAPASSAEGDAAASAPQLALVSDAERSFAEAEQSLAAWVEMSDDEAVTGAVALAPGARSAAAPATPFADAPAGQPAAGKAAPPEAEKKDAVRLKAGDGEESRADRCSLACRALGSMQRSAERLCELTGSVDDRCVDVRARVSRATARVTRACPAC